MSDRQLEATRRRNLWHAAIQLLVIVALLLLATALIWSRVFAQTVGDAPSVEQVAPVVWLPVLMKEAK